MAINFKDARQKLADATRISTQFNVGWHYCQSSPVSYPHEFQVR
jgi:hypothetical protein